MGDFKRIAVMEDSSSTLSSKRRRVADSTQSIELSMATMPIHHDLGDFRLSLNSPTEFDGIVNLVGDSCSSICCDSESPVSCCSSNESSGVLKDGLQIVDLEDKTSETLNSTSISNSDFRKKTLSNEMCQDSEVMEPPAGSHMRRLPEAKVPPRDEIEEFFATAEKYQKNCFAEKYNFDIVNDMPLEGRYQWIRLKP